MQPTIQKNFFVSEIFASELVSFNYPCEEQDTFHRQQMCSQAVPRFSMSIKETYSNSISLTVTNEYDRGAVMQISTMLVLIYHIAYGSILWNGTC